MYNHGPVREQSYETVHRTVEAIQFNGFNGRDVVDFLEKHGAKAKNGGRWVAVSHDTPTMIHQHQSIIRVHDFAVWTVPGIRILSFDEFKHQYQITSDHVVKTPLYSDNMPLEGANV